MTRISDTILLAGLFMSALLTGCTAESRARVDSAKADSTSATAAKPGALGVNVDASNTPPSPSGTARADSTKVVTFAGVFPLRIGMSAGDARRALGLPASNTTKEECSYLDTKGRMHAFVMLVHDSVARVDVRDSVLATDAGVRVGDAESKVLEHYRGRVRTEPHKYVQGGHYLIVASPSDSMRQLVFETDGTRVTSYRVGRMPEVRWVEGCG